MEHLALWRLCTDILLLLSLGFLCFQFARSPRINSQLRVVRELEAALRVLVREADGAGRSLNDQLLRRQQSIEKAIIDADLAEQRIQRSVARVEDIERQAASTRVSNEENTLAKSAREEFVPPQAKPARTQTRARLSDEIEIEQSETNKEVEPRWGKVNIYGEPIGGEATQAKDIELPKNRSKTPYGMKRATPAARPQAEPSALQSTKQSIDDVYAAAEELLRAGNGLATVASHTNLPIEEIRALSQMIIGERAVAQAKTASPVPAKVDDNDPRLGVMATMKRQTITV